MAMARKKPRFSLDYVVAHGGVENTVRVWLAIYGIDRGNACRRVSRMGWTLEDAVTTPELKQGATRKRPRPGCRFSAFLKVNHNGMTKTVGEWVKFSGLTLQRACRRYLELGWTLEDAVTVPLRESGDARIKGNARYIEFDGRVQTLSGWARELGISTTSVSKRLKKYPVEIALTRPRCDGKFVRVDGTMQTPPDKKPTFNDDELTNGVSCKLALQRMRMGWTKDEATKTPLQVSRGARWGQGRGNINRIRDLAALGIVV